MESGSGLLGAIEQSWLGVAARESVWLYPSANVGHILGLMILAGSIALIDARLLGAFREMAPGPFLRVGRRFAIAGLLTMLLTGSVLFAAEATHVSANLIFQTKLALIGTALANVLLFELFVARQVRIGIAGVTMPVAARLSAALSLGLWLGVATAGRLIAYF